MILSAIVAVDNKGVIGVDGDLPWDLPADRKYFKDTTMGHPVIMGRRTYESIGRPLPGRQSIIITHDPGYRAEGCVVVTSLGEAISSARASDEVFVIGGQAIYELAMPRLDKIYLTKIDADIEGDRYFKYAPSEWRQVSSQKHSRDAANPYDYEFLVLERRK